MPIIPTLKRLRQKGGKVRVSWNYIYKKKKKKLNVMLHTFNPRDGWISESKANLVSIMSSILPMVTIVRSCLQKKVWYYWLERYP